ncbi:MAG: hypothetical protein GZ091_19125 [Paludibacter sp.]|uniref:Lipoprotein n=1 Tax=Flavobacterium frigoris TaxID=229204 RepID=A0A1H9CHM5_FLAFI|nr:hypothetical protein [Flavobacterium frigoris]NDP23167.1 hypothetical protein [Paludibacter sp.]SEQ00706.1 hypothetical protein SAMN05444355_101177 [Flavobacterium frigoris]
MKHLKYSVIITILMISCTSIHNKNIVEKNNPITAINDTIRDKYDALNDFFDTKIKDYSKKIMVMSSKINTDMTLRMIRINQIVSTDSITKTGVKEDKTFYKEDEWEKAKKKYSKKTIGEIEKATSDGGKCCWEPDDFNYKNIIFEKLRQGSTAFINKYISHPLYDCYYFSEPIYYQNKEYLIFTVAEASLFGGLGGSSYIVILKKNKAGKWVQTHVGYPDWYN